MYVYVRFDINVQPALFSCNCEARFNHHGDFSSACSKKYVFGGCRIGWGPFPGLSLHEREDPVEPRNMRPGSYLVQGLNPKP